MRFKIYEQQKGSSLLEVMICLFMLSLPIFGMTALKLTQAKIVLQQSQYTSAWALMEYKLNELRYSTDSLDEFNALSSDLGGNLAAGNIDYDQYNFNLTWQVNTIPTSSALKQVVIQVDWLDNSNLPQNINSTVILNQGIIMR